MTYVELTVSHQLALTLAVIVIIRISFSRFSSFSLLVFRRPPTSDSYRFFAFHGSKILLRLPVSMFIFWNQCLFEVTFKPKVVKRLHRLDICSCFSSLL